MNGNKSKSGPGLRSGFISILMVTLVGVIGISVVVSILLFGLNAARDSFSIEQATKAKELATACVEDALERIRASTAYVGSGNLTLSTGTCSFTVSDLGGESRQITSTGTVASSVRRLTVNIANINPQILISSWQDVP